MTRVVGLYGSPRRGGNTEKLLDRFLDGAEDAGGRVLRIPVAALGIEGWRPGIDCADGGSQGDTDDFPRVSQELVAADVIAVAAPVYFRNVPAQLKAVIDRSQCHWIRKHVDKEPLPASSAGHTTRRGIFVSAGGDDREHFQGTIETVRSFFDVYETEYWGELLFSGVDAKEEIAEEPLALQEAYDLGFRAVAEPWA
jgi:putative NADPH-quinone reductase